MARSDRKVGIGIAVLALAVLWSARSFPNVPGQKLGAAFLPMLIGAGLLLCAIALILRKPASGAAAAEAGPARVAVDEHFGSSALTIVAVLAYILASEALGFLLLAPLCLLLTFLAQRVRLAPALLWSIGGTVLVHVAFYKLLRVPLPWGVLTPFY
ncbi:MAG: tripartite tricarboxylate transporter TctB family protein [Burkholderiaceae bacterium]